VELMKAECRFLIAYFYYLMVNTYGAVPFQDGLADLEYACRRDDAGTKTIQ